MLCEVATSTDGPVSCIPPARQPSGSNAQHANPMAAMPSMRSDSKHKVPTALLASYGVQFEAEAKGQPVSQAKGQPASQAKQGCVSRPAKAKMECSHCHTVSFFLVLVFVNPAEASWMPTVFFSTVQGGQPKQIPAPHHTNSINILNI